MGCAVRKARRSRYVKSRIGSSNRASSFLGVFIKILRSEVMGFVNGVLSKLVVMGDFLNGFCIVIKLCTSFRSLSLCNASVAFSSTSFFECLMIMICFLVLV